MKASTFRNTIYRRSNGGGTVLWNSKNRRSIFVRHDDLEKADEFCKQWEMERNADLYFAVASQQEPEGELIGRGSEDTVCSVPCVWVDVDCDKGESTKKKYPQETSP